MSFRKTIFWLHLVIGLTAGLVIAMSALTGATMAFQKQIIAWSERNERHVKPQTGATRLSLKEILGSVRDEYPEVRPQSIEVSSAPDSIIAISLNRTNTVYVDPYTGDIHPQGAPKARAFFDLMLRWHRWLAVPPPPQGKPGEPPPPAGALRVFTSTVIGVSCCILFTLSLSGLYLWWPRQFTAHSLRRIALMNFKLRGKPRDWNWHNAIGFWSAPMLILTTATGIVLHYHAVGDWIYQRPDNEAAGLKLSPPAPGQRPLDADALLATAQKAVPQWETITMRLASRRPRDNNKPPQSRTIDATATNSPAGATREHAGPKENSTAANIQPVTISVIETGSSAPVPVDLQIDPYTGDVLRQTRLEDMSFRQAFRALNKSLHTGEAGGIVQQTLSFLACLGALLLVWTGFALAWRRFFGRNAN